MRRQFEDVEPRRIRQHAQIDGQELELEALLTRRADMVATGHGSGRIWQAARQMERDVSVAVLIDAKHQCMTTRGVHHKNVATITTQFTGVFKTDADLRNRFLRFAGQ